MTESPAAPGGRSRTCPPGRAGRTARGRRRGGDASVRASRRRSGAPCPSAARRRTGASAASMSGSRAPTSSGSFFQVKWIASTSRPNAGLSQRSSAAAVRSSVTSSSGVIRSASSLHRPERSRAVGALDEVLGLKLGSDARRRLEAEVRQPIEPGPLDTALHREVLRGEVDEPALRARIPLGAEPAVRQLARRVDRGVT